MLQLLAAFELVIYAYIASYVFEKQHDVHERVSLRSYTPYAKCRVKRIVQWIGDEVHTVRVPSHLAWMWDNSASGESISAAGPWGVKIYGYGETEGV